MSEPSSNKHRTQSLHLLLIDALASCFVQELHASIASLRPSLMAILPIPVLIATIASIAFPGVPRHGTYTILFWMLSAVSVTDQVAEKKTSDALVF